MIPNGIAKWEALAECSLSFSLLPLDLVENDRSMFDITVANFANPSGLTNRDLYEKLMIGLCDHLNKKSLQIILKSKSGQSITVEGLELVNKLRLVANESNHFREMKLPNFKYPAKTLKLIYEALEAIDPNVKTTFNTIVSFVKYFDTFEHLDLPLNLIVKGVKSRNHILPFIKFNRELIGNSAFDNFISACHEHCKTVYFDALNQVRNIIYGPITDISTELFYEIFNQDLLKALVTSAGESKRLIHRIINTETYERFSIFFTRELIQSSPNVARFKVNLERQMRNYEAIEFIVDNDISELHGMTGEEKDNHFQFLVDHLNCMEEFYEIDPEYIGECVENIHEKIMEILEEARLLTTEGGMSGCAALIIYYFGLIPLRDFTKNLNNVNYEQVLDLLLNPLVIRDKRIFKIPHLRKVVYLSYVRIDHNTLSKYMDVLQSFYVNYDELFSYTAFSIFQERTHFTENEVFELFKTLHSVYESRQIDFEAVATVYLYKSAAENNGTPRKLLIDYVKEHKLVSKTILSLKY